MITRLIFVMTFCALLLIACNDRERYNCPNVTYTKNKALGAAPSPAPTSLTGTGRC